MKSKVKVIEFFLNSIKNNSFLDIRLFWQDDEEIEILKLVDIGLFNAYFADKSNGIYFLTYGRFITYIGISHHCMRNRAWEHLNEQHKIFNRIIALSPNDFSEVFKYIINVDEQIKKINDYTYQKVLVEDIEKLLINALSPHHNAIYNDKSEVDLLSNYWTNYIAIDKKRYFDLISKRSRNIALNYANIVHQKRDN